MEAEICGATAFADALVSTLESQLTPNLHDIVWNEARRLIAPMCDLLERSVAELERTVALLETIQQRLDKFEKDLNP